MSFLAFAAIGFCVMAAFITGFVFLAYGLSETDIVGLFAGLLVLSVAILGGGNLIQVDALLSGQAKSVLVDNSDGTRSWKIEWVKTEGK